MDLSDLTLEDLVETCPQCNGTGQIDESPAKVPASMGLRAAFIGPCPHCEVGRIYTPLGKVLREFVLLVR